MLTATLVKPLPVLILVIGGTATQQLFELSKTVTSTPRWEGDSAVVSFDYIIVSQSDGPSSNQTYVFPADADGTPLNYRELSGSTEGIYPHQEIANAFCRFFTE